MILPGRESQPPALEAEFLYRQTAEAVNEVNEAKREEARPWSVWSVGRGNHMVSLCLQQRLLSPAMDTTAWLGWWGSLGSVVVQSDLRV